MKRILIIGCGDIAGRLIPMLTERYRVFALVRNAAHCVPLRAQNVTPLVGDLDHRKTLTRLAGLADEVLHLAPPPGAGERDGRTVHLLAALSQGALPQRLIYFSTTGVYGDCGGARVPETHPVNPQSARARRRLDAEKQIRKWGRQTGVPVCILRVSGIYAEGRLPIERLQQHRPVILESQDGYGNHVHANDLARMVMATLRYGQTQRIYHASDADELKMGDYFDAIADALGLPRPPRLSRADVARAVSPAMWSFMNESRRIDAHRTQRELKLRLQYPTVSAFLAHFASRRPDIPIDRRRTSR